PRGSRPCGPGSRTTTDRRTGGPPPPRSTRDGGGPPGTDTNDTPMKGSTSMIHSLGVQRPARWGAAMAIAAVFLLSSAAGARAAIFRPADGPALQAAVASANTNGPGRDVIIMSDQSFAPLAPITISSDLVITTDHSLQATPANTPTLDASSVTPPDVDFI